MSNCELNNLPTLEIEQHQVREALRCIVHTIVFHRALGLVEPKDVSSELFDVTYVQCGDPSVLEKVEAKVDQLCHWIEKRPGKRGQVCVSFYEKRKRQHWLGFGAGQEERLFWEQWIINLTVVDPNVSLAEQSRLSGANSVLDARRHQKLQSALEEVLVCIVRAVNEKREHVPPVTSASTLTYPFDISIAGEGGSGLGLDKVRRMLMHTSPPPVLT